MVSVGVIGSGAWGTTLAILLARKGISTTLWDHQPERALEMQRARENSMFLPGIHFPEAISVTSDSAEAVRQKDLLLLVTPSQKLRANLRLLAPHLSPETLLVNASKGIEIDSLQRMTEVISEEIPASHQRLAAISGPNLSREVAEGKPTAAVVAAYNPDVAIKVQHIINFHTFRVYTSNDVIGVEMGGALKNIIAIGAGFNDGLGYGENAKAAIITRGLAEISRLGVAAGANPLTFAGLAGLGDLVGTCASPLSRNQQLGRRLAGGEKLAEILQSTHSVAEGVSTTRAALQLADRYQVEMPIAKLLSQILFEELDPRQAVLELMMRDPRGELEDSI